MSKVTTLADIRNPKRASGFDHVNSARGGRNCAGGRGDNRDRWRASCGWNGSDAKWRGPTHNTPEAAAQDYCNYVNGNKVTPAVLLKSAGHVTKRPKRSLSARLARARDLEAEAREIRAKEAAKDPSGYVYLVGESHCSTGDVLISGRRHETFVKVGESGEHPKFRLNGLQTGNPRKLVLLGCYRVKDRKAEESRLHAKHASQNTGYGEWFHPTTALLSEFGLLGDGRKAA